MQSYFRILPCLSILVLLSPPLQSAPERSPADPERPFHIGVLANHAPYVTSSAGGRFEIEKRDGAEMKFEVGAGFFEVARNKATFLTQSFKEISG